MIIYVTADTIFGQAVQICAQGNILTLLAKREIDLLGESLYDVSVQVR